VLLFEAPQLVLSLAPTACSVGLAAGVGLTYSIVLQSSLAAAAIATAGQGCSVPLSPLRLSSSFGRSGLAWL
jgi:hypothetical protein